MAAEILADPTCVSFCNPPEKGLSASLQLLYHCITPFCGPYFMLLLLSKDTGRKVYFIWAGVLFAAGGTICFGWTEFVNASATR